MFATDQAKVGKWARQSPENTARVIQFVILTIRQPLYRAAAALTDLIENNPDIDAMLYGFKSRACAEAWRDREFVHSFLEHVWESDECERNKAILMIEFLASMHGLGPVKAGFVAQLCYGIGGCLDTHNLVRFRIPMRAFSNFSQRKTPKSRRKMIARYVRTCYRLGGPEKLWNSWCEYVAENQPRTYPSAMAVSRLHAEAFGL